MKVELTKAQAVQVVVFLNMLRPELNKYGKQEIDDLVGALDPQIKEINRSEAKEHEESLKDPVTEKNLNERNGNDLNQEQVKVNIDLIEWFDDDLGQYQDKYPRTTNGLVVGIPKGLTGEKRGDAIATAIQETLKAKYGKVPVLMSWWSEDNCEDN